MLKYIAKRRNREILKVVFASFRIKPSSSKLPQHRATFYYSIEDFEFLNRISQLLLKTRDNYFFQVIHLNFILSSHESSIFSKLS